MAKKENIYGFITSVIILVLMSLLINSSEAQELPKKVIKVPATSVKDTLIKNVSYKMYMGIKGGKYIIVTSRTGNQYKRYFK